MKNFLIIISAMVIFSMSIIIGLKRLHYPSYEYDEGVYLTTFLLVKKGLLPYKETFLSQPPGYFYLTYPGFLVFGETLEAGRLTIFLWSLFGLLGILWLGYELENLWIGFLAIGILYLIPKYLTEILTFHADSLPLAFSAFSIAAVIRFYKTSRIKWMVISVAFATICILLKFDISTIFVLVFILLKSFFEKKFRLTKFILLTFSSILFAGLLIILSSMQFGINNVFENVVKFRVQAAASFSFAPMKIFEFIQAGQGLVVIIGVILLFVLKEIKKLSSQILLIWLFATLTMIMLYRPLMSHHLVILSTPSAILLSYTVFKLLKKSDSSGFLLFTIPVFIAYVFLTNVNSALYTNTKAKLENDLQSKGVRIILENTNENDYVVSDDGILTGLSKRLPPPGLADISYVRISSGNLTPEMFESSIITYKPKLILPWADRLRGIKGFKNIIKDYELLEYIEEKNPVYILKTDKSNNL